MGAIVEVRPGGCNSLFALFAGVDTLYPVWMNSVDSVVLPRDAHTVSRRNIDPDALKVLYRLSRHGFKAYLVGGSVRDLLLGRVPKDFDIGTDAHPQQIKRLFRNCFLIGRRFRLAHIRFGAKVIETCTFRREPESAAQDRGAIRHENTFGTPEEDARRRDFTVNGLFYDVRTFSIIDHVGGLRDLELRVIRSIGDPDERFIEDPVRMIRAVRFASRLGFELDPDTLAAIERHTEQIHRAPPSRLLEELLRLFMFGAGEAAFRLLHRTGLLKAVLPEVEAYLAQCGEDEPLLWRLLGALDVWQRDAAVEADSVQRVAALFCAPFEHQARLQEVQDNIQKRLALAHACIEEPSRRLQVPRRTVTQVAHVLTDQCRMQRPGRYRLSRQRFARRPWFRDALQLFELTVRASGSGSSSLTAWQQLEASVAPAAETEVRGRRRRRPRRRRRHGGNRETNT
jgi:poly(A) polymerase